MVHVTLGNMYCLRVLSAFALVCGLVSAQDISATLQGSVLDATGRSIPDAKVALHHQERNQVVRNLVTDAEGNYSAPLIPIGTYTLRVEAAGFKTFEQAGIVLNVSDNRKINVTMQIGAVSEKVEVSDTISTVDMATPASSATIEGKQVRELSLGTRNYQQLVVLSPGVSPNTTDELYIGVSSPSGTAATLPYSINGQRNSANNWTLDGADNVDRGSNLTLLNYPSIDAISQFKIERSLYTADSGRAGGGQINVVTKSGTSEFHGNAYEFVRNDAFAANNWINNTNKVNLVDGKAKVPPLRWNDFGFTIGGPVFWKGYNREHNKTFFFYSQEWRKVITYTTFQPTIPTAAMIAGTMPAPVCISYTTSCQQTATQIAPSQINRISQQYIKDIYRQVTAVRLPATPQGFFPQQQHLQPAARKSPASTIQFQRKVAASGARWMNDSIPTTEPGGLFTGIDDPRTSR